MDLLLNGCMSNLVPSYQSTPRKTLANTEWKAALQFVADPSSDDVALNYKAVMTKFDLFLDKITKEQLPETAKEIQAGISARYAALKEQAKTEQVPVVTSFQDKVKKEFKFCSDAKIRMLAAPDFGPFYPVRHVKTKALKPICCQPMKTPNLLIFDNPAINPRYPHTKACPLCGSDGYRGASMVDCSNVGCSNHV